MTGTPAEKEHLRTHFRAIRKQVSAKRGKSLSKKISRHFPAIGAGKNVAAYIPMAGEVDTWDLMKRLTEKGATLLLPVVVANDTPLSFYAYKFCDGLVKGQCGNEEPQKKGRQAVPDIMVVPLVAFDETGARLGQGGGYYDRTLAILRKNRSVLAIGLAFEAQKHDSLPVEVADQPLDAIVTEKGVYDFRPKSRA